LFLPFFSFLLSGFSPGAWAHIPSPLMPIMPMGYFRLLRGPTAPLRYLWVSHVLSKPLSTSCFGVFDRGIRCKLLQQCEHEPLHHIFSNQTTPNPTQW
jgi:hypothetical protein